MQYINLSDASTLLQVGVFMCIPNLKQMSAE